MSSDRAEALADYVARLRVELAHRTQAWREARDTVEQLAAELAEVTAERDAARADAERYKADADRSWGLLTNARTATRRLTTYLIANAARLDTPFSNTAGTPWSTFVGPAMNRLRAALGMRGVAANCCDLHGRNCEPGELCCEECSEAAHPHHVDGSFCSAPDLSGFTWPAPPVEDALRDEVERLAVELAAARRAAKCAGADRIDADLDRVRARREWRSIVDAAIAYRDARYTSAAGAAGDLLVAAVDTYTTTQQTGNTDG